MAEIKDGILGGVKGKVGTVVGYDFRGRNIIRALPRRSSKAASDDQILQRSKFKIVMAFLKGIRKFVNAHYPIIEVEGNQKIGIDQLRSTVMKKGLLITEDTLQIIPVKVLLSIGVLSPAAIKKVAFLKDYKVKVQWDDTIVNVLTQPTDQLIVIVYNDELDTFHIEENVAKREDKYAHFNLNENWTKGNIHFWSVWTAADQSMHSTSIYHTPLVLDKYSIEELAKQEQEAAE
ncbi:hypothetical protein HX071_10070 [Myroides marinus]|uniref:DUF6266 family protein n=1 Tax=Myroides marinus TaxID=703342 RepID=UPI0025756ABC|nr:DUF6266 family protein [Myroides marinus]MDM1360455.1 hypothetical protein [Myroides marinus]MDM1502538.1 hypothetical protein [Myroides marinus]